MMMMMIKYELILNWFVENFVPVVLRTKDIKTYKTNVLILLLSAGSQEMLQLQNTLNFKAPETSSQLLQKKKVGTSLSFTHAFFTFLNIPWLLLHTALVQISTTVTVCTDCHCARRPRNYSGLSLGRSIFDPRPDSVGLWWTNPRWNRLSPPEYISTKIHYTLFQVSAAKWMRSAFAWVISQWAVVIPYRRFGTKYRPETSVRNCHYKLRNISEKRRYK